MQVNVAGLRRNLKNLAHNYSDAQVKVREATSNDPWGPSSTIMSEIADLTYNVVAFSEIMQMVWKRLNDHGRNWRHVYKALVLLEYLIKTGSEKVAQQCRENIFAIETLKDFQHIEESKDQGINVREKAKQLVSLLRDDERLKNERARALKARERFAQASSGFGSDSHETTPTSPTFPEYGSYSTSRNSMSCPGPSPSPELECARPQTSGEEELQLQLALAMSREEAEQEEQRRRSDDVRLQLALSQSEQEYKKFPAGATASGTNGSSHLLDLLEVDTTGAFGGGNGIMGAAAAPTSDPWGMPLAAARGATSLNRKPSDPWSSPPPMATVNRTDSRGPSLQSPVGAAANSVDPWVPVGPMSGPAPAPPPVAVVKPATNDPWVPAASAAQPTPKVQDPWSPMTTQSTPSDPDFLDEFDVISNRRANANVLNNNAGSGATSPNPFDLSPLSDPLPETSMKKTPETFLGENSSLVNLDNLIGSSAPKALGAGGNPFALTQPSVSPPNPFHQQQSEQGIRPSINQMRQQQNPFAA